MVENDIIRLITSNLNNVNYETFREYNTYIKKLANSTTSSILNRSKIPPSKVTIENVDFKKNTLEYKLQGLLQQEDIDVFIHKYMVKYNIYVSNPSLLKQWAGFKIGEYAFLSKSVINYVNALIPTTLFSITDEYHKYFNKQDCSLTFKVIDKKEIGSFLLRNKIAYECEQIENHFWYIKNKYNITIVSDLPIYTPINSSELFEELNFYHLDLSEVNLSKTKSFSRAFLNSNTISVEWGTHPKTNSVINLDSMFESSSISTIDLRKWDLTKVTSMNRLCAWSRVDNVYVNINTPSLKYLDGAFKHTTIIETNIDKINAKNVITMNCMFEECKMLFLDLTSFDIEKLVEVQRMFAGSVISELRIRFRNKYLTNLNKMFSYSKIDKLYVDFNYFSIEDFDNIFFNANISYLDFKFFNKQAYKRFYRHFEFKNPFVIESIFDKAKISHLVLNQSIKEYVNLAKNEDIQAVSFYNN